MSSGPTIGIGGKGTPGICFQDNQGRYYVCISGGRDRHGRGGRGGILRSYYIKLLLENTAKGIGTSGG